MVCTKNTGGIIVHMQTQQINSAARTERSKKENVANQCMKDTRHCWATPLWGFFSQSRAFI